MALKGKSDLERQNLNNAVTLLVKRNRRMALTMLLIQMVMRMSCEV